MKNRWGAALVFATCSLCAWGQSAGDSQRGAASRPPPYTGGGIRGALAPVPQGVLVTGAEAQEFMGEAGFNEPPPMRTRGLVPTIEILQPQPGTGLKTQTTFAISVQFRSEGAAPAVPSTFKVLYGANRVDITSRMLGSGQLNAQGFTLERAQVPPGKHKLVFQIEDTQRRVAERELRFEAE
jgi:hypothetical protein